MKRGHLDANSYVTKRNMRSAMCQQATNWEARSLEKFYTHFESILSVDKLIWQIHKIFLVG